MKRNRLVLLPSDQKWSIRVNAPFDEELQKWMKQFPGAFWFKKESTWRFPLDLLPELKAYARELGYSDFYNGVDLPKSMPRAAFTFADFTSRSGHSLHDFQKEDIPIIAGHLEAHGASHALWEMGLGKEILQALMLWLFEDSGTRLIVTPRQGMGPAKEELEEWAGYEVDQEIHEISPTAKKRWLVKPDAVNLISYGLVKRALKELDWPKLGLMVGNEIHEWKKPTTHKTQAGKKLLRGPAKDAMLLGMTGTLVSNRVDSMLEPMEMLYPGRFKDKGNPNHFYYRHQHSAPNPDGYGHKFWGVRNDTLEELKNRLALTGVRRTKREVAHLLPGFVGPRPVESSNVLKAARDHAIEGLEQGLRHISIHTTRRKSAAEIRDLLVRKLGGTWQGEVAVLTGEDTSETRDTTRNRLEQASHSILISTIKAMKVGINLSWNDLAIWAEITNDLETMLQNIGRYDRLYTHAVPTTGIMLYEKGNKAVKHMATKIEIYEKVQGSDRSSEAVGAALREMAEAHKLTDDDINELLMLAVSDVRENFGTDWDEEKRS